MGSEDPGPTHARAFSPELQPLDLGPDQGGAVDLGDVLYPLGESPFS